MFEQTIQIRISVSVADTHTHTHLINCNTIPFHCRILSVSLERSLSIQNFYVFFFLVLDLWLCQHPVVRIQLASFIRACIRLHRLASDC